MSKPVAPRPTADDIRRSIEEYGQERFEDGMLYAARRIENALNGPDGLGSSIGYRFKEALEEINKIRTEKKG